MDEASTKFLYLSGVKELASSLEGGGCTCCTTGASVEVGGSLHLYPDARTDRPVLYSGIDENP